MTENIYGLFAEEIGEKFVQIGVEKFRSSQVADWMYKRAVTDFNQMTNLSGPLRTKLRGNFYIEFPEEQAVKQSADGKTVKSLLRFDDGEALETVLMRQPYGNSVCVSSQVGCAMGCKFCASTLSGLERNLTGGEMLAQVQHAQSKLPDRQRVSSVVIMGGDEPLANLDPPHQADWLAVVRQLVANGSTVVSVLHELSMALHADELVIMAAGRIIHQGACADAITHRALEEVFDKRIAIHALNDQWVALPRLQKH